MTIELAAWVLGFFIGLAIGMFIIGYLNRNLKESIKDGELVITKEKIYRVRFHEIETKEKQG